MTESNREATHEEMLAYAQSRIGHRLTLGELRVKLDKYAETLPPNTPICFASEVDELGKLVRIMAGDTTCWRAREGITITSLAYEDENMQRSINMLEKEPVHG